MKKKFKFLTMLLCLLLVPFTSCSSPGNNKDNDKISYYNEFKFLPMYPGAEKVSYTPPEKDGFMGKGVYTIDEKDVNAAITKYQSIFEKDGWTVKKDEKNPFIECSKGDHTAAIIISLKNDVPTIEILAK